MTTYPFEAPLFVDAVTFTRAPNAKITIYDELDLASATPLALTDPNGLALANPMTSSPDAFGPNFRAPTPRVKWSGGGLTGFLVSPTAVLDEAKAARTAAETAKVSALDAKSEATAAQAAAVSAAYASYVSLAKNPDLLVAGAVNLDGSDQVASAVVQWPDGTPGTLTITDRDSAGNVMGYDVTYGSPVTKTFRQPKITRNANGAATNVPQIVVI